jgi:hypothetical protein
VDVSTKHIERWHIIFTKTTLKHWIFRWIDPHFQHCYAVKESAGGEFWIILDAKNCVTEVRIESKMNYPHIRCLSPNGVILSMQAIIDPSNYRYVLGIGSCVDVCKSVLGISDFWCWTPYQLYKRFLPII